MNCVLSFCFSIYTIFLVNVVNVNSQNVQPSAQSNSMERQQVLVKVLKDLGGSRYLVSLFGKRIEVSSLKVLSVGENFIAKVKYLDSRVIIEPKEIMGNERSAYFSVLEKLGVPCDDISFRIFLFMQQSGFRIDRKIMALARKSSLYFEGDEEESAEIACMLLEKGIEPTEDNISELLGLLKIKRREKKHGSSPDDAGKKSMEESSGFLASLFPGENFNARGEGLLSMVNHLKNRDSSSMHWLAIPYEWENEGVGYTGIIRLLLNLSTKETEKIQINCERDCKKFYFVVYLKQSKVNEVRFCTLPPLLASDIQNEERRLGELFGSGMNQDCSVTVTYSPLALIQGLYSSNEEPRVYESIV